MGSRGNAALGEPPSAATDESSLRAEVPGNGETGGVATAVAHAWITEVSRRRCDLRSGVTQAVPWADAKARLSRL